MVSNSVLSDASPTVPGGSSDTAGTWGAPWPLSWLVVREKKSQMIVNAGFPFLSLPGEPFSQEEMEEMLSAAIDPESNLIHYKDYIATMVIDES